MSNISRKGIAFTTMDIMRDKERRYEYQYWSMVESKYTIFYIPSMFWTFSIDLTQYGCL